MEAIKTLARFFINGAETPELLRHLKSLRYSDSLENESDVVEIILEDAGRELLRGKAPERGSKIRVELIKNGVSFNLGEFEIDEVCNRYPPSECRLKLNSIPRGTIRGVEKYRAWENVRLSKIARDIAAGSALDLYFDAPDEHLERVEQSGSDLQFITNLARNYGLNVKVSSGKLIIFEAARYEGKAAAAVIKYGEKNLLHFEGTATLNQIYDDARAIYKSNNVTSWLWRLFGGADLFQSFSGVGKSGGVVLNLNERVESLGQAEKLSKSRLREKNKTEWKVELQLRGDFRYNAGSVIELADFGVHSGRYLIDRADHNLDGGGYTARLSCHKCLGY